MNKLYNEKNKIIFENVIYTVDMLRLRTNISFEEFSKIEFFIKTFFNTYEVVYYVSTSISAFKYNYVVKFSENSSFWFGFLHNSELISNKSLSNENTKYNFTIEFNPNKVDYKKINYILNCTNEWVLNSLDVAMDIKINILDLFCFDKKRKRSIRVFSNGYDNKTIYLGKADNRVKIYNKKIESNLNYELTRIEISSKINKSIKDIMKYYYSIELPEIYLNNYVYSISDLEKTKKKDIMYCILYALQEGFDINDLTRKYKDKVKKMLEGGYKINFSNECCTKAIQNIIKEIYGEKVCFNE